MSGSINPNNTSQDPEYVGPTFHEKKFHQTHFQGMDVPWKRTPIDQDPDYVRIAPGRYRYVGQKRSARAHAQEVENGESSLQFTA